MSDDHKSAIASGRNQTRVMSAYLEALASNKPRRGRRRTAEGVNKQLATLDERIRTANAIARLSLVQERMNLSPSRTLP